MYSEQPHHASKRTTTTPASSVAEAPAPEAMLTRGLTSARDQELSEHEMQSMASDLLLASAISQVQGLTLVVSDLQEQLLTSQATQTDSSKQLINIEVYLSRNLGPEYKKGLNAMMTRDHRRTSKAALQEDRVRLLTAAEKRTEQLV